MATAHIFHVFSGFHQGHSHEKKTKKNRGSNMARTKEHPITSHFTTEPCGTPVEKWRNCSCPALSLVSDNIFILEVKFSI